MRCPKCGYISFDHLDECRKCHKNIEAISSSLYGTAYSVQPPTFLNLHREPREEDLEEMEMVDEETFGDDEYVDDELAILVEEEDTEGDIDFAGGPKVSALASAADEQDEDGEIEIDFSQFEAADDSKPTSFAEEEEEEMELAEQDEREEFAMKMDVPEGLSDISDLAPPAKASDDDELPAQGPAGDELTEMSLDDLNFDLGLDDLDKDQASPGLHEEAMLALDEIDFSGASVESSSEIKKKTSNEEMEEMDLDLDFELDLGGLSIHKDI